MIENESMLIQEREGIAHVIDENRITLNIKRKPLIINSFGNFVDDPYGVGTTYEISGRISHSSAIPLNPIQIPSGENTNMSRFLLVEYDVEIFKNDIIENYLGERWTISYVDVLEAFQGIIGYQAKIIKANNEEEGT